MFWELQLTWIYYFLLYIYMVNAYRGNPLFAPLLSCTLGYGLTLAALWPRNIA